MQTSSRRVKAIYAVVASPNRLEILRILNTKGALSYSELKTLAGFKSKKESGKFAYHLRKLVKQMLVSLNRSERKYTVTNLGRLVLNLTRQIEEQSVVESGKIYVRTSKHRMEEFNANRILQSLVREAGMPVELAEKITAETEARIYKFQTAYLTAPLIREMVNAVLIEQGHDTYRHKLTRLGLPVHDVSELLEKSGEDGVVEVLGHTARTVSSEYLFLTQLPRDVSDAHLAGDIHISRNGLWGLVPDTVFVDLIPFREAGLNFGGRLPTVAKLPPPENLTEALTILMTLASLLSGEVSSEVVLTNITTYLQPYLKSTPNTNATETLTQALTMVPAWRRLNPIKPSVTLDISTGAEALSQKARVFLLENVLGAYKGYVETVPQASIRLVLPHNLESPNLRDIISIARSGGALSLAPEGIIQAFSGIRCDFGNHPSSGENRVVLHALSVNLPRLAYDSSGDETYFRARLAMQLQLSSDAFERRRRILRDVMKRSLLPGLTHLLGVSGRQDLPVAVNLVGLKESARLLLGEQATSAEKISMMQKIVGTANKVLSERASREGVEAAACVISEEGVSRLYSLDAERMGRQVLAQMEGASEYSQGLIVKLDGPDVDEVVDEISRLGGLAKGGLSVSVQVPETRPSEEYVRDLKEVARKLGFLRLRTRIAFCRNCGTKAVASGLRCKVCRSTSIHRHYVDD